MIGGINLVAERERGGAGVGVRHGSFLKHNLSFLRKVLQLLPQPMEQAYNLN